MRISKRYSVNGFRPRCRLIFDGASDSEYKKQLKAESHLQYASAYLSNFVEVTKGGEYRVLITGPKEINESFEVKGPEGNVALLYVGIRRLGVDIGMDTLFTLDEILRRAVKHTLGSLRDK